MDIAIETRDLTKTFEPVRGWRRLARRRGTTAVRDVNLTVEHGELFGLLGPNGAGKTTLVKMLCTLILPTSGTAMVGGYPLTRSGKIREEVGLVVTDERSFYWRLTGRENLQFFASMYRLYGVEADERVSQVLAEVNLLDHADKRFSNYSTGLKQRLAIARSLLHQPQILFLDEPSRSLDPSATHNLHQLILQLIDRNRVTIFLITHDLSEAEKLCQRVAVMHQGQIQVVGQPADLRRQLQPHLNYAVRVDPLPAAAVTALTPLLPDFRQETLTDFERLHFQAGEADGRLTAVLDTLRQHGVTIHSIEGYPPSLEEVFSYYTGLAGAAGEAG